MVPLPDLNDLIYYITYRIMEKSTCSKLYLEINLFYSGFSKVYSKSTPLLIAMTLHIHDTVELIISQINVHLDAIGKTVDGEVGAGEFAGRRCDCWWWITAVCWVADIALDTFTNTSKMFKNIIFNYSYYIFIKPMIKNCSKY